MKWSRWIATGFGAGYFPVAPGTAGSLVGLVIFYLIQDAPWIYQSLFVIALTGIGIYAAGQSEVFFKRKDPSEVVIDEMAAMALVLLFLPSTWPWRLAGFLLFRFFDIVKPPPTRYFEKFSGGWGIMLDDLWAAACALFLLRIVGWLYGS